MFDAWPGLTLISWETTLDYGFTTDQVETLMAIDSPRAEFFRRITWGIVELVHQTLGRQVLLAPDGLAIAVALEQAI